MERASREREEAGCGKNSRSSKMTQVPNDTDKQLAQELNQLSLREREQVFEDIHGVSKIIDEDPDFVDECLLQMDMAFRRLKRRKEETSAYETAFFLAPRFVMDRDFRLMFLRSESFDPNKALDRMVQHFESKLELFGSDKLVKLITQDDLHEVAKDALRIGNVQPLPTKDRSGRKIIFIAPQYQGYQNRQMNLNHVSLIKGASVYCIAIPTCYHVIASIIRLSYIYPLSFQDWRAMVYNDENFAGRRRGATKWLRMRVIL
jgi:hypothetical protein